MTGRAGPSEVDRGGVLVRIDAATVTDHPVRRQCLTHPIELRGGHIGREGDMALALVDSFLGGGAGQPARREEDLQFPGALVRYDRPSVHDPHRRRLGQVISGLQPVAHHCARHRAGADESASGQCRYQISLIVGEDQQRGMGEIALLDQKPSNLLGNDLFGDPQRIGFQNQRRQAVDPLEIPHV
ncbi:MAG: hypothetical protein J2P18_10405 [Nocardia sp.]|nr:hypothetical protein [Nocardia sp.]